MEHIRRLPSRKRLFIRFAGMVLVSGGQVHGTYAQSVEGNPTQLEAIVIEGADTEDPTAPTDGNVAKSSISGAKTATPIVEVPQSLSVVTADQMKAQGARSAGDALRYSPGVLAEPGGGNESRRYDFQNIRGLPYVGHHYRDGLKATFGVGNLGMPQFDPFMLERIELLRGPASVLYGLNDPGGVINMVSKRPTDLPGGSVHVGIGTNGYAETGLDTSDWLNEDGSLRYRFVALGRRADNQVDFVKEERLLVAPSLTWEPSADTSFTLLAHYQRDPEGGYYGSLPEAGTLYPTEYGYTPRDFFVGDPDFDRFDRTQAAIGYEFSHRLSDVWTVRQNLRFSYAEAELASLSAAGYVPPSTYARSSLYGEAETRAFTTDMQAEAEFETGPVEHTVLFGLDYFDADWSQLQGIGLAGVPPIDVSNPVYGQPIPLPDRFPAATVLSDADFAQRQVGLYVQDQIRLDRFFLTGGLRWDRVETQNDRVSGLLGTIDTSTSQRVNDSALSVRIGAGYEFDNGLVPYASYSTSFTPELGVDAAGNAFEPLEAEQFEVGLRYQPPGTNILLSAAAFRIEQENALTTDPDPTHICLGLTGPGPCQVQEGVLRSQGIELEAKLDLDNGWSLLGSYSWLDAEYTEGPNRGGRPIAIPEHTAALWGQYEFSGRLSGLTAGAGLRYVGATYVDAANTTRVPSHTLVDAGLSYDFGFLNSDYDGLALSVHATNLTGEKYVTCYGQNYCNYGAGRSVIGRLSYEW